MALVRNESMLAVANSHGVALLDASAALGSDPNPIVGTAHYGRDLQTIRVLESADGRWLFASDEHNRTISILDLSECESGKFNADCLVSQVPVDLSPLGMASSADGKYIFVTCEMSRVPAPDLVNWFVWGATLGGHLRRAGVLSTIDLDVAVDNPEGAVIASPTSGGHPVRINLSHNGAVAWVTARASNQLLAFCTKRPESPNLIATIPVGPAPVGLAVLDDMGVVLVANSNRFASEGRCETLSVIDIRRALAGQPACLGQIPVGSFPREIGVDPCQGFLYVTNFDSHSLTIIPMQSLESAVNSARAGSQKEPQ